MFGTMSHFTGYGVTNVNQDLANLNGFSCEINTDNPLREAEVQGL
jgi:hypothetical protein